ncbi:hypothetical protein BDR07DRAFT_1477378 [Suillus spraguei]|nr:hypothetical protein BDR07DRAFT_1477378 [Suillus spraguei]
MATAPTDGDLNAESHPMMRVHDADMRRGCMAHAQGVQCHCDMELLFPGTPNITMILVCLMAFSPLMALSLCITVAIMMLPIVTLGMVMSRAIGTLQVVHILVWEADMSMGMGMSILRTQRMEDMLLRPTGFLFDQLSGHIKVTPSAMHILYCIVM